MKYVDSIMAVGQRAKSGPNKYHEGFSARYVLARYWSGRDKYLGMSPTSIPHKLFWIQNVEVFLFFTYLSWTDVYQGKISGPEERVLRFGIRNWIKFCILFQSAFILKAAEVGIYKRKQESQKKKKTHSRQRKRPIKRPRKKEIR